MTPRVPKSRDLQHAQEMGAFWINGPVQVAVIVVTFRSGPDVEPLLASLRHETSDQTIRVVIADNNSTDDTVDVVRTHPDVVLVETGGNLGYSGGINRALAAIGEADAVFILNPDATVVSGCIKRLRERMIFSGAGVVVPTIETPDGRISESLRREPTVSRRAGDAVFGSTWPSRPSFLSETVRTPPNYTSPHRIAWATGAAMLISGQAVKQVGMWDERFFLYSEETDYFKRVRDAGFEVWFEPTARIVHREAGSGRSPALVALTIVNSVRYTEKHRPMTAPAHRALLAVHELRRWHDPAHRIARTVLLGRNTWDSLPHADAIAVPRTRVDHVIVTRFNLPSEGAERLIRAKDGWLRDRIGLFERYTVPSVVAQTVKNFRWIVYLDPQSPDWLLDRLAPLVDAGQFIPLYRESVLWRDVAQDARSVTGAVSSMLVTTNLDNDDAIASDFIERIQASVGPNRREALFLGRGIIRAGSRLYLVEDRHNAFCSVAEPWDDPQTAWRDWHTLLGKHMPSRCLDGRPGWLQVIHDRNVSNRVRGRLVSPIQWAGLFPGTLDDIAIPTDHELLADRVLHRPLREVRGLVRSLGKSILMKLLGKDGLGSLREKLRRIRPH